MPRAQSGELRVDERGQIGRTVAQYARDLRERQPRALERHHASQPFDLGRPVEPRARERADGPHQPARLVET